MATSIVSIWNLALQKVGQGRVASTTEDNSNTRHCAACYDKIRRAELRKAAWNFSLKREILAPSVVAPAFKFTYAFPVPTNSLRILLPPRLGLDWSIEAHEGREAILTNDGDTLYVRYIEDVTDPTRFDANFEEMLACKMGWNLAEILTQSNAKKEAIKEEYKEARNEARRLNAFEKISDLEPEDPWLASRRLGSDVADRSWAIGASGGEY